MATDLDPDAQSDDDENDFAGHGGLQYVIGCIGTTRNLAPRIHEILGVQGLHWKMVADRLVVSRQTLRGGVERERVSFRNLDRICREIGVDPMTLFDPVPIDVNRSII